MRIAEGGAHRMAHHQLGRVARLARVAVVARAILLPLAKEALATADREGDDDALPLLQCRTGAGFDDLPHELVPDDIRSEEHTSELQSLMRISYAVICLKKKTKKETHK